MADPALDAFKQISAQELKRAGLGQNPDNFALDALLGDSDYQIDPGEHTGMDKLRHLLMAGDPDTDEKDLDSSSMVLRHRQLQDFKGRGWSKDDMDAYEAKNGPLPDKILSQGGQQADSWRNNREFVDRYADLDAMKDGSPSWVPNRVKEVQSQAAQDWQSKVGREYGDSGWGGFMNNPEYTLGNLMSNFLDPIPNAIAYRYTEGGKASDSLTRMLIQNAAGKVDPILPGNPKTPAEKEQAYKLLKGLMDNSDHRSKSGASAYDHYYRRKHGEYPSYAGSTGQDFLRNMTDPTVALGALGAGKGIFSIGKALLQEGMEEIPLALTLGGGMTAYNEFQQYKLPQSERKNVNWSEMMTPGVRDELPDENRTQFENRDKEENAARQEALKTAPSIIKTIPRGIRNPFGRANVMPVF